MIPNKIFEIGSMLGLKQKDVQNLIVKKQTTKPTVKLSSPIEVYKSSGGDYGTISINDF